jgi:hypothetical protein
VPETAEVYYAAARVTPYSDHAAVIAEVMLPVSWRAPEPEGPLGEGEFD